MTKFQQALREELAGRLKSGKIRSTQDLSDMMTTMFWEAVREVLLVETDQQLGRPFAATGNIDMYGQTEVPSGRESGKRVTSGGRTEKAPRQEPIGRKELAPEPGEPRSNPDIEAHVFSLYSHGMSVKDIESCIKEFYGVDISKTAISKMTDWISSYISTWKNRALEKVYLVVWIDTYISKVRQDGRIVDKAIHVAAGLNSRGHKEVLGLWTHAKDGPPPWMQILTHLKNRGVADILLVTTVDQAGFSEALKKVFSRTRPPSGIVPRLRSVTATIPSRDRKSVKQLVREICESPDIEAADEKLEAFEQKWAGRYPQVAVAWQNEKENKKSFFELPMPIRRIIDSVDLEEVIRRSVPRHTHSRTIPANDQAAEEAVYMGLMKDEKKWSGPLKDWPSILVLFIQIFGERTEPKHDE